MNCYSLDQQLVHEVVPGMRARFVHSQTMTIAHWQIDAGAVLPRHSHRHEQICNVIEGEFELTIDGITKIMSGGDIAVIPSNATHSGVANTDCKIIDVFQPVREDYLALGNPPESHS